MGEICSPTIAISGNLFDEPICNDEREALVRLGGICIIGAIKISILCLKSIENGTNADELAMTGGPEFA